MNINHIANLAKLHLQPNQLPEMESDMNRMLTFVEKLNELNTDNVFPLIYMTDEPAILRNDEVKPALTHEQALMNAPSCDSDYFKVPRIIERK